MARSSVPRWGRGLGVVSLVFAGACAPPPWDNAMGRVGTEGAAPPAPTTPPADPASSPQAAGCRPHADGKPHVCGTVYRWVGDTRVPVAGEYASVWLQTETRGSHYANLTTDAAGAYDFTYGEAGRYVLFTVPSGLVQPCAATVVSTGRDLRLDIELVSLDDAQAGVRPRATSGYTLTGVARQDGAGKAGLGLGLDITVERPLLATVSGPDGAYFMCGLWPGKVWYGTFANWPNGGSIQIDGDTRFDFDVPSSP